MDNFWDTGRTSATIFGGAIAGRWAMSLPVNGRIESLMNQAMAVEHELVEKADEFTRNALKLSSNAPNSMLKAKGFDQKWTKTYQYVLECLHFSDPLNLTAIESKITFWKRIRPFASISGLAIGAILGYFYVSITSESASIVAKQG